MIHGEDKHRTTESADHQAREGRSEAVSGLGACRGLARGKAVYRASGEAEGAEVTPEQRRDATISGARKAMDRVKRALNPAAFCAICGHTEVLHKLPFSETQHVFKPGSSGPNQ